MTNRLWKTYIGIAIIGSLISLFFGYAVFLGFLLGVFESFVHYKRLERYWNAILDANVNHTFFNVLGVVISVGMMIFVLVLCALFPKWLNIYACAVGMFMIKITVMVESLLRKEGTQ